jgi:hypothetical protein
MVGKGMRMGNGDFGIIGGEEGRPTKSCITRFFQGRMTTRKMRTLRNHHRQRMRMRIWIAAIA